MGVITATLLGAPQGTGRLRATLPQLAQGLAWVWLQVLGQEMGGLRPWALWF